MRTLLSAADTAKGGISSNVVLLVCVIVLLVLTTIIVVLSRYRKCPSDKILVIYGKVGQTQDGQQRSAKCIHGGASFIWPVVQAYEYLDLTPMSISVDLRNALSKQNIRVDVPSRFTVGISTENGVMQNAAERLLGMRIEEIKQIAEDIIFGQMRLIIATMDIEEINSDRDKFLEAVSSNVETELKKIGLRLINVNVTDITDESGYIIALGKEAASKAINDAKVSVAEADRVGSIGAAEADRDMRISVSKSDAEAITGENEAKARVADSDATRREREAEAMKRATAAENIAKAKAQQESFDAQKSAEEARAHYEQAKLEADVIVKTEIERKKKELEAEAEAEQIRRRAKGEADATLMKMQAEADGLKQMLTKQAEGFAEIVKSAGGDADSAVKLMIADKLEEITRIQVDAIKNLQIDKITVWDSGARSDGGKSTTADFISGLYKSIPPLSEMFDMAGMNLPSYLGEKKAAEITDEEFANMIEAPKAAPDAEQA